MLRNTRDHLRRFFGAMSLIASVCATSAALAADFGGLTLRCGTITSGGDSVHVTSVQLSNGNNTPYITATNAGSTDGGNNELQLAIVVRPEYARVARAHLRAFPHAGAAHARTASVTDTIAVTLATASDPKSHARPPRDEAWPDRERKLE